MATSAFGQMKRTNRRQRYHGAEEAAAQKVTSTGTVHRLFLWAVVTFTQCIEMVARLVAYVNRFMQWIPPLPFYAEN